MRSRVTILSVSQLNRYIKAYLEEDDKLQEVYVEGELSNVVHHYASGHLYFTLKDQTAAVRAVMFRGNAAHLRFEPEDGMSVLVRGFVTLYERDGTYQLNVQDIQPTGVGSLQVALEQLKQKLQAEGIFDSQYKQPIPRYPQTIAVITSAGGAALQDVIHVISRRCPMVKLIVLPAAVQGQGSVDELLLAFEAVKRLRDKLDTVILCRGGGSLEDLMSFNDERVVRAVFACPVPVISAVGHEVDTTLCDFAADLRAPTPSAAAEVAVPDQRELYRSLAGLQQHWSQMARNMLDNYTERLQSISAREVLRSPEKLYDSNRQRLGDLVHLMKEQAARDLKIRRIRTAYLSAQLDSLSPLQVLARGYTITTGTGDAPLRSVQAVSPGETIRTWLADGTVVSKVVTVDEKETEI